MGGYATTMIIIMVTISVGLMFFGVDSGVTSIGKMITINQTSETITSGESADISGYINTMLLGALISGGLTVATYVLVGGQMAMYTLLLTFLFTFAFLPISILTMQDIPFMFRAIVGAPVVIGYIFALVGWFRGADL